MARSIGFRERIWLITASIVLVRYSNLASRLSALLDGSAKRILLLLFILNEGTNYGSQVTSKSQDRREGTHKRRRFVMNA